MVDVKTGIIIQCPKAVVSTYTSDPDNATNWYVNIKSVEWVTSKPLAVGSQIAFIAYFIGKKLSYTYEVMEMSDERFVMRTAQGPFPMETTYEWKAIDANTTMVTLRNKGNPSGFSKLWAPFMSIMMRRANQKDLKWLKQVLEKN